MSSAHSTRAARLRCTVAPAVYSGAGRPTSTVVVVAGIHCVTGTHSIVVVRVTITFRAGACGPRRGCQPPHRHHHGSVGDDRPRPHPPRCTSRPRVTRCSHAVNSRLILWFSPRQYPRPCSFYLVGVHASPAHMLSAPCPMGRFRSGTSGTSCASTATALQCSAQRRIRNGVVG